MSLSSPRNLCRIYKQLFTDAEWQIIDYALSEYQDHLDEDDTQIEIYNSILSKTQRNLYPQNETFLHCLLVYPWSKSWHRVVKQQHDTNYQRRNRSIQQTINNL